VPTKIAALAAAVGITPYCANVPLAGGYAFASGPGI
jgi:hypothetical protein